MLGGIVLIVAGLVAGTYGTIVGAGGGFILVPLLLLTRGDLSPASITTLSLGAVFLNAASGTVAYVRQRRIDYKTGLLFAAATVPMAAIGALLVNFIPRSQFQTVFGCLLVLLAVFIFVRPGLQRAIVRGRFSRRVVDSKGTVYEWTYNAWFGVAASLVIGFVAALLGIGGGIMQVPIMVSVLAFPAPVATATSTFVLLFTSASGTVAHLAQGDFQKVGLSILLAGAGMVVGAQVGARLSHRLSGQFIVRLLAAALAFAGVRLILGGLGH